MLFLRSQRRMTGLMSSSDAVTSNTCGEPGGFHAMAENACLLGSFSSHQGLFCRRSQMMHDPFLDALAMMCMTWRFHATELTGASCFLEPASLGA